MPVINPPDVCVRLMHYSDCYGLVMFEIVTILALNYQLANMQQKSIFRYCGNSGCLLLNQKYLCIPNTLKIQYILYMSGSIQSFFLSFFLSFQIINISTKQIEKI